MARARRGLALGPKAPGAVSRPHGSL